MIIQLDYTEQEMIRFLQDRNFQCYKEKREFEFESIVDQYETLTQNVVIVINHNADEIMVPDEMSYRMKNAVLQETFTKEFKKASIESA